MIGRKEGRGRGGSGGGLRRLFRKPQPSQADRSRSARIAQEAQRVDQLRAWLIRRYDRRLVHDMALLAERIADLRIAIGCPDCGGKPKAGEWR